MTNQFIELAQAQFVLLREAEIHFSDSLVDTVQQFVTFRAAAGQADRLPDALKQVNIYSICLVKHGFSFYVIWVVVRR